MSKHTPFLALLVAATWGTVVLTGAAASGGPSRVEARSRPAAVRLPAPQHLSAPTRAELRSRMGRHGNTMSNLVRALVLLDRPTIATLAGRIADEEVVARVEGGGPDRLTLLLPKEFFVEASSLQASARGLVAAATNKEEDSVMAERFASVAKTCVSCHSVYLRSPSDRGR